MKINVCYAIFYILENNSLWKILIKYLVATNYTLMQGENVGVTNLPPSRDLGRSREDVTPGFKAKTECSRMCSQEQVSHIRRLHKW